MLALSTLDPRDLRNESRIDVAAFIEAEGADAFRAIVQSKSGDRTLRSPANRIIHPGSGSARQLVLDRIARVGSEDNGLRSHGISEAAAAALKAQNVSEFLRRRHEAMAQTLSDLGDRFAGWNRHDGDRPSIKYLIEHAADDA
jgi:hypothetical protein